MRTPGQATAAVARSIGLACFLAFAAILALAGTRSAFSSPPPALRLEPSSIKVGAAPGSIFTVDVVIEGVSDLGAFEFELGFDTAFVKLVDLRLGPFLGSTQRPVTCQERTVSAGVVKFGCNTQGPEPPGPDGSGVVAHIDLAVQGHSLGDTRLRLYSCNAADILGGSILSNTCKDSKLTINPPTPTPTQKPRMRKLPPLQNLFLTRQGEKLPPVQCVSPQGGDDIARLAERLSAAITSPDPKNPQQNQQLGAFEFEVHYDWSKVCVQLVPGPAATGMTCVIQDAVTKPTLEGVARVGCVTQGKGTYPDTTTPEGRHLATILVRPQPDVYSQGKANQDNGVMVQLIDMNCELADAQGHPIKIFSCEDAGLTIRYLEGDVEPDCSVDTLDTQATAFRWGSEKGTLVYNGRFNLEPSGARADDDIDIKDLQFVYGRLGSTCASPHPPQPPVNPKGGPTPTATATPPEAGIKKSPHVQELLLSAPPQSGRCEDGVDAASFQLLIKDPITSPDPKTPSQLQQLGAFEFTTRFDPSVVCVEITPGNIPQGEMSCRTQAGSGFVHFGCTTISSQIPPIPQPPGVLAVITVRPQPDVYESLLPDEELTTQLLNQECGLSDLLGHSIPTPDCAGATIRIRYP
ncbi:MAG: hypothetical protein A2148_09225 [Chloroflexi bacterium RBG_16_68_14]|nr:MAG: hypothetical protein A2148_09225 [Chloroflexi bacterium RBG_16_68_14]